MTPWKRTYWTVWLSNLITSIGMMSFLPFFPTHLAHLGLTDRGEIATWTGLIFGAAPLMAALMGPVWGAVGDAFGRRLMILRALFAISLFVSAMALATSPLQMFLLRLMQGVFSGFVAPSITLVSVVAPPGAQGRVTGSLQTALAVGTIVGPLCGAWVEAQFGLDALFLAVGAAALLSAACVLLLVPDDRAGVERRSFAVALRRTAWRPALRGFRNDLVGHLSSPHLRAALAVVFGAQFAIGATMPQMELFVRDVWDGDPASIAYLTGLLFSIMAVTDLVCMPIWGHLGDVRGHRRMIRSSSLLTGGALLVHAFVPVYAALVLARVLLGSACAGLKPCAFGLMAEETAVERRGSAIGIVLSARQLAVATAAMTGGWFIALLGLRGVFAALGVALLFFVVALTPRATLERRPV